MHTSAGVAHDLHSGSADVIVEHGMMLSAPFASRLGGGLVASCQTLVEDVADEEGSHAGSHATGTATAGVAVGCQGLLVRGSL